MSYFCIILQYLKYLHIDKKVCYTLMSWKEKQSTLIPHFAAEMTNQQRDFKKEKDS